MRERNLDRPLCNCRHVGFLHRFRRAAFRSFHVGLRGRRAWTEYGFRRLPVLFSVRVSRNAFLADQRGGERRRGDAYRYGQYVPRESRGAENYDDLLAGRRERRGYLSVDVGLHGAVPIHLL